MGITSVEVEVFNGFMDVCMVEVHELKNMLRRTKLIELLSFENL